RFLPKIGPFALYGLLFTIVMLFAIQGDAITSPARSPYGLRGPGTTRPTTSDHEPLSITKPSYTTKRDLTLQIELVLMLDAHAYALATGYAATTIVLGLVAIVAGQQAAHAHHRRQRRSGRR
ncbi:hypothetical protein AB0L40_00730, partial [Patulibacter sp. NPDC049589]|uniref:hypothetical protein n=1 Tax=Patulibacter sp. NPDC049589 TaxID=3154731 RepID=UPI00344A4FC4